MTFFEEMVYAGQRGLSDAHRTYNAAQGASFNTHATRRVCGAMLDFIKEEFGGAVRLDFIHFGDR
jgi:DNA-directed RNA polymerase specialized sigma subunit